MRQDPDKVNAETDPVVLIEGGKRAEQQRIRAERKRAERHKRNKTVEHCKKRRGDVVEKKRRHHL